MSKVGAVALIIFVVFVILSLVILDILAKAPRKIAVLQNTPVSNAKSTVPNPSAKLDQTFVQNDSKFYSITRGTFISAAFDTINYVTNEGAKQFKIKEGTKIACLSRESEKTFVDLSVTLDGRTYRYADYQDKKSLVDPNSSSQIMIAEARDKTKPDVLWVFGCEL